MNVCIWSTYRKPALQNRLDGLSITPDNRYKPNAGNVNVETLDSQKSVIDCRSGCILAVIPKPGGKCIPATTAQAYVW